MSSTYDCRSALAAFLLGRAAQDERLVVVVNDSVSSGKLTEFAGVFPERLINVGIAEQNMVGIASGLARSGMRPVVCAASCFLTGRAMEQIKVDVAYSQANVTLVGMSPGVAYGALGATHHSIEDVSWMRAIPNIRIAVPSDDLDTVEAVRSALAVEGPAFVRVPRILLPRVTTPGDPFRFGAHRILREGRDLLVCCNGIMTSAVLQVASNLARKGVELRVLELASVRPLDEAQIARCAQDVAGVVTIEEGVTAGGIASAVLAAISRATPKPALCLGIDEFAPTGSPEQILRACGLDVDGLESTIENWFMARNAA